MRTLSDDTWSAASATCNRCPSHTWHMILQPVVVMTEDVRHDTGFNRMCSLDAAFDPAIKNRTSMCVCLLVPRAIDALVVDAICGNYSMVLLHFPRHVRQSTRVTVTGCRRRIGCAPSVPWPPAQPFHPAACTHRHLCLCASQQRRCLPWPVPLPGALTDHSARGCARRGMVGWRSRQRSWDSNQ